MRNQYQDLIKYHHQKEREQIIIGRIIGGLLILTLFIIMPALAHYL